MAISEQGGSRATGVGVLLLVALIALVTRGIGLDRRPMHHDEANQAVRCGIVLETGDYRYDANEHHGPSLYYLTLPSLWLTAGRDFARTTEFGFRIVPVLFSVALLMLLPLISDGLGRRATAWGAAFAAASPGLFFYSRFYIQETLLVFFTFAAVICAWRYLKSGRAAWAALAGASLGAAFATKETAVIAFAAMAAGLLTAWLPTRGRGGALSSRWPSLPHLALGLTCAAAVWFLLFSSFFTNWRGPLDSLLAFRGYLPRGLGIDTEHNHPWYYYLRMLAFWRQGRGPWWSEGAILAFALVGIAAAFAPRGFGCAPRDRGLPRFLAGMTLSMALVYSAIPYKTPWCMLSFLFGLTLLGGFGISVALELLPWRSLRAVFVSLALVALAHLSFQSWRASGPLRSSPSNPYVYAHTSQDVLRLARRLRSVAETAPPGLDALEIVTSAENAWPLPWYLRGMKAVRYPPGLEPCEPVVTGAAAIVAEAERAERLQEALGETFRPEYYGLRPGVLLVAFVRSVQADEMKTEEDRK